MNSPAFKSLSLLLPSLGALVIAGILYSYLYWQTSASADRAVAAEAIVQSEQKDQSQAKDIELEYQTTADARTRLSGLFVPAGNAVVFIETLESIGPASGATVSISSIQADPMTDATPGTIGSIAAGLQVTGTWPEVMKALVLAESLPYYSSVDQVSLVASGAVGHAVSSSWNLSFNVSASMLAGPSVPTP